MAQINGHVCVPQGATAKQNRIGECNDPAHIPSRSSSFTTRKPDLISFTSAWVEGGFVTLEAIFCFSL
ncbi:hypothetical protein C5748_00185 [Phyllobacterium phragmitis]|uniref:Uncharacterized protein n=1 Tax=Phyllobacterium phragmitis TaxID=2670329 RepID=A0A2S9IYM6_9HYPH|nr:hypothetical protein [Phyllobacterium phragmitis]PRD45634.1 hypothetical protein C5748_00185 [Phyllobacterium phragmitis]